MEKSKEEKKYIVNLTKNAEDFYNAQDEKVQPRLDECFSSLEVNPFFGPHIKKLGGKLEGFYRYRIGDIRVVYEIRKKARMVFVEWINKRKDVYMGKKKK